MHHVNTEPFMFSLRVNFREPVGKLIIRTDSTEYNIPTFNMKLKVVPVFYDMSQPSMVFHTLRHINSGLVILKYYDRYHGHAKLDEAHTEALTGLNRLTSSCNFGSS